MKTKTYEIEVITTKTIKVVLPETFNDKELLASWERGLWSLPKGLDSIAEHAAELLADDEDVGNCNHDGVGRMITSKYRKPDYVADKYQVVAIEESSDIETSILNVTDWLDEDSI